MTANRDEQCAACRGTGMVMEWWYELPCDICGGGGVIPILMEFTPAVLRQFLRVVNEARIPAPGDPTAYLEWGLHLWSEGRGTFEVRVIRATPTTHEGPSL